MAGLRTERELRDMIARRLARTFAEDACDVESAWPWSLPLGRPSRKQLVDGLESLDSLTRLLRSWQASTGVEVVYEMREAGGPKRVPTHMVIPSAAAAARLATPPASGSWTQALARTHERRDIIRTELPDVSNTDCARALRKTDAWEDLEFELLVAASVWFASHDATGLTPRQVPLPGIDAKWLDAARHRQLVCLLARKTELGLRKRPARLDFAYLDPTHHSSGRRRFDSWQADDVCELAYFAETCIIVENKDTFLDFPNVPHGICVFGSGKGGIPLVSSFAGVSEAQRVWYWGDLDADGFEILNGYRAQGVRCTSILMNLETLERFERYGTTLEKDHRTRIARDRKQLDFLTSREQAAYERLTDPTWHGNLRIEQEKIPLEEALRIIGI